MKVRYVFCRGPEEVAAKGAESFLSSVTEAAGSGPFTVALSGGRIAPAFYSQVVRQTRDRSVWKRVHFFWADERLVPPDDDQSNFKPARDFLFRPLGIEEDQIHRIKGELQGEFARAEAESELRQVAARNERGVPVLDLVVLGMGEDGHVASLFPGAFHEDRDRVYLEVTAPKPPPRRITLTQEVLLSAHRVVVLISGQAKADALERSLRDGSTPLGQVLKGGAETTLFADIRRDPVAGWFKGVKLQA